MDGSGTNAKTNATVHNFLLFFRRGTIEPIPPEKKQERISGGPKNV